LAVFVARGAPSEYQGKELYLCGDNLPSVFHATIGLTTIVVFYGYFDHE
jgi:hypothetical protein